MSDVPGEFWVDHLILFLQHKTFKVSEKNYPKRLPWISQAIPLNLEHMTREMLYEKPSRNAYLDRFKCFILSNTAIPSHKPSRKVFRLSSITGPYRSSMGKPYNV